jgi:hypothetical protein
MLEILRKPAKVSAFYEAWGSSFLLRSEATQDKQLVETGQ